MSNVCFIKCYMTYSSHCILPFKRRNLTRDLETEVHLLHLIQ